MEAAVNRHLAIHADPISLTLDSEGRWRTFRLADRQFRRLVNGKAVEIVDDEPLDLSKNMIHSLHAMITRYLEDLAAKARNHQIPSYSCNIDDPQVQSLFFQRATDFIKNRIVYITDQYLHAYPEPITMLPPDRYRDLVLLPATGCPQSGKCTFCTLYPNSRFRVLSEEQFDEHVNRVMQLFGSSIFEKTGIFLGSASALSLSQRRLVTILSIINSRLGSFKRGISSFLDPYHAPLRSQTEYGELRELGLQQVTIGLESGSPLLRQKWGKSADLTLLQMTVNTLKESGIRVSLTILTGFHKKSNFLNHITDTVAFIRSLPLSHHDILYISPLDPSPVSIETSDEQAESLKHEIRKVTTARVVPYFVNKFRYYA